MVGLLRRPSFTRVAVEDLVVGDVVDLEGDRYADPGHGRPGHRCPYEYEYVRVGGEDGPGAWEGPVTYRLDHDSGACGFPRGHRLRRVGQDGVLSWDGGSR